MKVLFKKNDLSETKASNLQFYKAKLTRIPFPCYCKRSQKAGMDEFQLPVFNFTLAVSFVSQNQLQCCTIIN